eukprot:37426_1
MGNHESFSLKSKGTNFSEYYVKGNQIGRGTFATVRKCVRKADNKQFAVKVINKKQLTPKELSNLREEVKILQQVNNPNVIDIFDVFESDKKVKIVLELCEGGHLFDNLHASPERKFTESKSAEITYTIATSLKDLHSANIVHRDLKPENILFTKDGTLKITDFGSASQSSSLRLMNTECGTPWYVAPEILSNKSYSYKCDLWSLGVILYIMLSGHQPFTLRSR